MDEEGVEAVIKGELNEGNHVEAVPAWRGEAQVKSIARAMQQTKADLQEGSVRSLKGGRPTNIVSPKGTIATRLITYYIRKGSQTVTVMELYSQQICICKKKK